MNSKSRLLRALPFAAFLALPLVSSAVTLFQDDFTRDTVGTLVNGLSPLTGGNYSVTTGTDLTITSDTKNGNVASVVSTGSGRTIFANFAASLDSTNPILTLVISANFTYNNSSFGYAGISFYTSGGEKIFIGHLNNYALNLGWGYVSGGSNYTAGSTFQGLQTATFTYNYNTGDTALYAGSSVTGTALISVAGTTGTTGLALNELRLVNASGADFSVTNLAITAGTSAIPEPSTYAALLGLAALGFVAHRRGRIGQV